MKTYICHKKVKAAKLIRVPDGMGCWELDDGSTISFEGLSKCHRSGYTRSRYTPVRGDYLVEYEDGYRSVSPQKAFEDGYTLESDGRETQVATNMATATAETKAGLPADVMRLECLRLAVHYAQFAIPPIPPLEIVYRFYKFVSSVELSPTEAELTAGFADFLRHGG